MIKYKAKINIVNMIDTWCHSIARLRKIGYSVVCISQLCNYPYGCSFSQEMVYSCLRSTQAVIPVIGLNLVELLRN